MQELTPIAELAPSLPASSERAIKAIVTLVWPYSSFTSSVAFLLAEPDFRLRHSKGQVRVQFVGPSGEAVARSGVGIGDEVILGLVGAAWVEDGQNTATPGKSVDWELRFSGRLEMQAFRDAQMLSQLSLNEKFSPPHRPEHLAVTPLQSKAAISTLDHIYPSDPLAQEVWASPAFFKQSRVSQGLPSGVHDPFVDGDGYLEERARKRRKSWKEATHWSFIDRTPSPTKSTTSEMEDIKTGDGLTVSSPSTKALLPGSPSPKHSPAEALAAPVLPETDLGQEIPLLNVVDSVNGAGPGIRNDDEEYGHLPHQVSSGDAFMADEDRYTQNMPLDIEETARSIADHHRRDLANSLDDTLAQSTKLELQSVEKVAPTPDDSNHAHGEPDKRQISGLTNMDVSSPTQDETDVVQTKIAFASEQRELDGDIKGVSRSNNSQDEAIRNEQLLPNRGGSMLPPSSPKTHDRTRSMEPPIPPNRVVIPPPPTPHIHPVSSAVLPPPSPFPSDAPSYFNSYINKNSQQLATAAISIQERHDEHEVDEGHDRLTPRIPIDSFNTVSNFSNINNAPENKASGLSDIGPSESINSRMAELSSDSDEFDSKLENDHSDRYMDDEDDDNESQHEIFSPQHDSIAMERKNTSQSQIVDEFNSLEDQKIQSSATVSGHLASQPIIIDLSSEDESGDEDDQTLGTYFESQSHGNDELQAEPEKKIDDSLKNSLENMVKEDPEVESTANVDDDASRVARESSVGSISGYADVENSYMDPFLGSEESESVEDSDTVEDREAASERSASFPQSYIAEHEGRKSAEPSLEVINMQRDTQKSDLVKIATSPILSSGKDLPVVGEIVETQELPQVESNRKDAVTPTRKNFAEDTPAEVTTDHIFQMPSSPLAPVTGISSPEVIDLSGVDPDYVSVDHVWQNSQMSQVRHLSVEEEFSPPQERVIQDSVEGSHDSARSLSNVPSEEVIVDEEYQSKMPMVVSSREHTPAVQSNQVHGHPESIVSGSPRRSVSERASPDVVVEDSQLQANEDSMTTQVGLKIVESTAESRIQSISQSGAFPSSAFAVVQERTRKQSLSSTADVQFEHKGSDKADSRPAEQAATTRYAPKTIQSTFVDRVPVTPDLSQPSASQTFPRSNDKLSIEAPDSILPPTPQLTQMIPQSTMTQDDAVVSRSTPDTDDVPNSQGTQGASNSMLSTVPTVVRDWFTSRRSDRDTTAEQAEHDEGIFSSLKHVTNGTFKSVEKLTSAIYSPKRRKGERQEADDAEIHKSPTKGTSKRHHFPAETPHSSTPPIREESASAEDEFLSLSYPRTPDRGLWTTLSYYAPLSTLFSYLNASTSNKSVDVLALVVRPSKPPAKASGGPKDYYTIFSISDPSKWPGITQVQVFRPWKAAIPVAERGDAVLLRNFSVKSRKGKAGLISREDSAWCVWRFGGGVEPVSDERKKPVWARRSREECKGPPVEIGDEERAAVDDLRNWWLTVSANENTNGDENGNENENEAE